MLIDSETIKTVIVRHDADPGAIVQGIDETLGDVRRSLDVKRRGRVQVSRRAVLRRSWVVKG